MPTNLDKEIKKSNILIVDDNAMNVSLLESVLENEGYEDITSTLDPRTVLSLCSADKFDLILLDIRMPYMSGFEVLKQLNKEFPDEYLPVLVLTAQTDLETKVEALKLGAKDFLTKPFEQWEVLLRIKNLLETQFFYKRQLTRGDLLEEEVRKRTEEIKQVQLEIVRRLGLAGEFRDNETGAHIVRMSKVAAIIGKGMGLEKNRCELLLYSSPMHDVGKIGIPDRVLLKPGKLDSEEREIMKTHCEIGRQIIGDYPSEIMCMASTIALYHHEKWDGSGYPRGLKGKDIPLYARIAAVSDVFDALLSRRPYKEPWPVERALDLIRREAGRHFDPEVVDVFFKNIDEILNVIYTHPDDES